MHPESQRIIGQILAPTGGEPSAVPTSAPMSIEQIINPQGAYAGPDRRARGVIIAEPVDAPTSLPVVPAEER